MAIMREASDHGEREGFFPIQEVVLEIWICENVGKAWALRPGALCIQREAGITKIKRCFPRKKGVKKNG